MLATPVPRVPVIHFSRAFVRAELVFTACVSSQDRGQHLVTGRASPDELHRELEFCGFTFALRNAIATVYLASMGVW